MVRCSSATMPTEWNASLVVVVCLSVCIYVCVSVYLSVGWSVSPSACYTRFFLLSFRMHESETEDRVAIVGRNHDDIKIPCYGVDIILYRKGQGHRERKCVGAECAFQIHI